MGRFKQLRVWQEGLSLAEEIYKVTAIGSFAKDYGLKDQIRRAAVSVSSNISEGDERGTDKESIYYFNMAKGSAAETITQLHLAYRIGYIDKTVFAELENKAEKIRASLKKLIAARKTIQN